jgi:hypothetical protein
LGIFGFSAVSISNAKRVKDALEKTAQEELTDVKKERVAVYVNMLNIRYAGKLNGATLQNDEGGLKVIADADEANKIIRVNALALMELDQDLVDNIILNHELMHIKGIKSELRAHLNDIFSFKGVKSYLFGKKSLASPLLNFYSALDDYNAYKNFEDGYEKAEKIYFLIKSINILRSSIGADVIKIFPPEYAKQVLEELESNVASELLKDYKTLGGDSKQVVNKNLEKYKEILEVYKVKEAADRKKDETEDLALAEKALKEKEFKEENEALPETELKEKENIQSSIILLEEIVNVYEVSKTEADFEKAEKALEAIKFDVINEVETSLIAFKKAIEAYGKNKTKETFEMLEVAVSMAVTRVENSLKAKEFDVQEDVVKTLLSSLEQYKKAIENYSGNKTVGTSMALAAAEKAALDARSLYIEERMKILRPQVGQVCKIIEKLYGISPEEEIQQLVMTLEYMRSIKEGHSTDVENFLLDENLDGEIVMRNYKGLVVRWSDIKKEKYESNLKEISVAFSLGLAGIGESLDRVRFLKAWYVLQVRQGEAKTDAEREAISKAVENGEFLNPEWYTDDYAKLIRDKKMQEKYGLDITTEDNPKFKTEAGDPQLKTKALDIGLRVRERKNGYWTIKSVAEIILDDFIAKKNAGFAGLTLNLLTNNESLEDVKKLLKKVSSTGKTYEEELINLDVLKKVQDKEDGVYLQKTHPTIQYDEKTGKVNFFRFQQLINHGSFFANLVRQMVENKEKSADNKDIFWFFGNTDNFLAGQVPLNLFGWMDATKTPAVIIVTEKGTNEGNKKGGIPMIVGNAVSALGTSVPIFKIIEIAQVKGDKVLEKKFQESTKAFFNTNMLVVSKHEIISLIEELKMALNDPNVVATISKEYPMKNLDSKEKIMERLYVLGDLIINNKENYVKLEIAISSSLMELNNLIALATGKTLLKFVFLNDEEAQEMFGPIKNKDNFDETFENSTMDMNNPNPHEKGIHPLSALKTQDESSQSGVQKFIKDIINRLIEPLRREWKRAYITKYYPELAGLEDILVYGEGVYEKGSAIEKIALEKADLGKNVNVVIPVGSNDITNATVKNTGNMYIYEKTFVQKNGFAVRVYFYENKSAAYNAYKYVVDNLDGLVGIVENASDISFNDIIVASPLAAIFAITKNAEEDAKAKRDGYSNVTNGISEIDKIEILGDTQKINRDGDDMRNQLPLITNIDLSKINDANIEALISTVFSVELTLQEFYDKAQALKDFIKKTHSKNKRVVLNFKPVNKAEAEDIIEMIGKKGLKILRTAGIGIDGIIFDFNSLQQEEFNEIKVRLEKIPSIIKRENSTAIISVKSAYYTEQQRISGIDNFDEYINISGNYNDNTVDANEIAESARKAIKGGAKALFIDYEILKLFVTKGINIDIYSLFLGIVAVWTSYVKKTPEGIYKNARRSGFRENISAITLEQETKLYDVLKKLDAGDESVIKGVGTILQTSKANTLETKEEAQGYVQGVLERILVSRFGEKTFEYRTNADVYRIALVKAKMNNISDNDIKKYLDDKGGENSRNALEKYGMSTENLNFSQAQEAAQEGINAIISDLENDTVRPEDLPQALADLLVMLSVVKTIEVEVSHVEVSSQRDGVRAMLSAA